MYHNVIHCIHLRDDNLLQINILHALSPKNIPCINYHEKAFRFNLYAKEKHQITARDTYASVLKTDENRL